MKPSAFVPVMLGVMLLGTGCASAPPPPYKLYSGPARPAAQLAKVQVGQNFALRVDGLMVDGADWSVVELPPGRHEIVAVAEFGASVMVEPSGVGHARRRLDALLAAGHTYEVHYDRTYGQGYRVWVWLVDVATGAVVAGEKKT